MHIPSFHVMLSYLKAAAVEAEVPSEELAEENLCPPEAKHIE